VILGFPDDAEPGIYVWPWRLEEDVHFRNVPPRINPGGTRPRQALAKDVHVLIMVRPALTLDGLSKLEAARQAILDQPILDIAGKEVRITIEVLDATTLAALFMAASIPLTICLSAVLSSIDDSTSP
jgi:hypothetical protein